MFDNQTGVTVSDPGLASSFTQPELRRFKSQYESAKKSKKETLSVEDIKENYSKLGFLQPLQDADIQKLFRDFEEEANDGLSFEGFLRLQADVEKGTSYFSPLSKPPNSAGKQFMKSPVSSAVHVISESEKAAYVAHINSCLKDDKHVARMLPINAGGSDLFEKIKEGVLLCKLINVAAPGTIDERAINTKERLNAWERNENHTLCLNSARAIGCQVVNIGTQDLAEAKEHLILGLLAQIIKVQLLASVNIRASAELAQLVSEESNEQAVAESPEKLLLRWLNHHLKKAGYHKEVTSFGHDLKDGEAYTLLLHELAPSKCDLSPLQSSGLQRAERVLQQADRIGCRKYLQPRDIVEGQSNLNLAFVANLFQYRHVEEEAVEGGPGEKPLEVQQAELTIDSSEDSDEERVFRFWINSVGVTTPVTNLFYDVRDGYVLLEVMDRLRPGSVNWKKAIKPGSTRWQDVYRKMETCQQVVDVGRSFNLSLVNFGGADISNGNKKLILSLLWQLMRFHMLSLLQSLKHDHEMGDADIIKWANEKVEKAERQKMRMESFKDRSLSSGVFFLTLMAAVEPRVVNWEIVTPGSTEDEKQQNAHYIISVARKLGCSIFLVPNDIVKVRPKMTLMLTASIMAFSLKSKASNDPNVKLNTPTPVSSTPKVGIKEVYDLLKDSSNKAHHGSKNAPSPVPMKPLS